jgi:hypothetical protein
MRTLAILLFLSILALVVGHDRARAHDLEAGGRPVPHFHQCTPVEIQRRPANPGTPEVELITLRHHQAFSDARIAQITSQARAVIAILGTANVVHSSPPHQGKNCHGITFGGGDCWIDDPTPFLPPCQPIPRADARAGDVVVYRLGREITHTGRVTRVDGADVWVHSQWGKWGDFDHKVESVPRGEVYEFEPRPGQKARGVNVDYGTPEFYRCP